MVSLDWWQRNLKYNALDVKMSVISVSHLRHRTTLTVCPTLKYALEALKIIKIRS